jgi:hypothetical protein
VKKDAAPTVLGRRRVTMAVVLAEGANWIPTFSK